MTMLACVSLAGCLSASINEDTARRVNERAQHGEQAAPPAGQSGIPAQPVTGAVDYRVGPLDVLEVEVYDSKELTRTVRITAGGEFSMPLVGRLQVNGMTIAEVQDAITKRLAERYFEDPQVSVFVKEYLSQRVTVEGAVKMPGVIALTGRTSLLQLVSMTGGIERDANPGGIIIYRNIDNRRNAAVFDLRKIRTGELIDPEVIGGDVVVVDYSGFRSTMRDVLVATPLLAVFIAAGL
jgi:polysaccharide export outer membrane protein